MGLKEMFRNMDADNSGTITLEELRQGLAKQGTKLSETEVKQLLEAVSFLLFFNFLVDVPQEYLFLKNSKSL